MDTRNILRLLTVLEHLAKTNTKEETEVLTTASPYIPKLTLGDVKDTIKDLQQLLHAQQALENIRKLLQ